MKISSALAVFSLLFPPVHAGHTAGHQDAGICYPPVTKEFRVELGASGLLQVAPAQPSPRPPAPRPPGRPSLETRRWDACSLPFGSARP